MGRLLGRLRNKRGSVLFLVVMVMSLLIIAASATLYIVSNQQSATTVRFSSEQSYQSAMSVSNAVFDYIDGYASRTLNGAVDGIKDHETNIVTQMLKLNEGESFTTFADGSANNMVDLSNYGLGNVKVEIKRVPAPALGGSGGDDEDSNAAAYRYEITSYAEVNGETTSITQVVEFGTGSKPRTIKPFTKFLTSTGEGSSHLDTFLSAMGIYGDAYFENGMTSMSGDIKSSLYCTGSLIDNGISYGIRQANGTIAKDQEVVIAKNFYMDSAMGHEMPNVKNVFVGGDMTVRTNINPEKTYVRGNLDFANPSFAGCYFVQKNCTLNNNVDTLNKTIFVGGDLYLIPINDSDESVNGNLSAVYVCGRIYVKKPDGTIKDITDTALNQSNVFGKEKYESKIAEYMTNEVTKTDGTAMAIGGGSKTPAECWEDVQNYIDDRVAKNSYVNWDAEDYFDNTLNKDNDLPIISPGKVTYGEWGTMTLERTEIITGNCILKPSTTWSGDYGGVHNIIIDTTKSGGNVYIKLQPLSEGEFDPNNTYIPKDTFAFINKASEWSAETLNVLVKGPYAVIFILPEGVNFKMTTGTYVGHAELAYKVGNYYNSNVYSDVDNFIDKNTSSINSWFYAAGNTEATTKYITENLMDSNNLFIRGSDTSNIHNNIFLVSRGDGDVIDLSATGTFCGFIYGSKVNLIANSGGYGSFVVGIIGGIIVDSYRYVNASAYLIFTNPYDYNETFKSEYGDAYDPSNFAVYIMEKSGAKAPNSGDGSVSILKYFNIVGYK